MNLFKGMQEKLNLNKFSLIGDADGGEKKHTDMFHREKIVRTWKFILGYLMEETSEQGALGRPFENTS